MRRTLSIRVDEDLAAWLDETSRKTGLSQGRIVRDQLQIARGAKTGQGFMRLAGCVTRPADLSSRKGFSGR